MSIELSQSEIEVLAGSHPDIVLQNDIKRRPFSDSSLSFVKELSKRLMSVDRKLYPEIFTAGFDIRDSVVTRLQNDFFSANDKKSIAKARGRVFHIPPTNVETVFLYTLVYGILSGCSNLVRLSERSGRASQFMIDQISASLELDLHEEIAITTSIFKCSRESPMISKVAIESDVRVWWGGDESVSNLKRLPSKPRAIDLSFPDRWSIALVDAEKFLNLNQKERSEIVSKFASDIYLFDQLACSSPKAIYWIGSSEKLARAISDFDNELYNSAMLMDYDLPFANFIDKAISIASENDISNLKVNWIGKELASIQIKDNVQNHMEHSLGSIFHVSLNNLSELESHIDDRVQTIVSFGIPQQNLSDALVEFKGIGVDRVVSPGNALSFSSVWDGINLIESFTRKVDFSLHVEKQ